MIEILCAGKVHYRRVDGDPLEEEVEELHSKGLAQAYTVRKLGAECGYDVPPSKRLIIKKLKL